MTARDPGATGPPLGHPARLAALRRTRLGPEPDAALDRFAALVRKVVDVPVALVSLVDDARQFFPGSSGLEPRQTPISHSFCQRVVLTAEPLVISDARQDARVCDNPAITDLSVIGYAGMPLTDGDGHVLGSLCMIDNQPRDWNEHELDLLSDLAAACSAELRLRIAAGRADQAQRRAETALAEVRSLSADLATAWRRSELLLSASRALTSALTVPDVVEAVAGLVSAGLTAKHVSVALVCEPHDRLSLAAKDALPAFFCDRAEVVAAFPHLAEELRVLGWEGLALAPLPGPAGPLGTIRFAWSRPHPMDRAEQAVIVAVAGYVAQALQRALDLAERLTVAETLQRSMLTELPEVPPYRLAARYRPARVGDSVGGDWYDAVALPAGELALVIGDVSGHDITAAARMGQLRSMLRGFLVDRREPPSAVLGRLDAAIAALGEDVLLTALIAVVEPVPGGHRVVWSGAGHPPGLLLQADGTVEEVPGRGLMLGVRPGTARVDLDRAVPPGATLLLFTDGLVETRADAITDGLARLAKVLTGLAGADLDEILDTVLDRLPAVDHEDDIAVLALRVPG